MSRGAATNQSTEPSTNESEGCKSSQSCEPTLVTHYFRVSTSLEYHQNQWDSRSELETIDTTLWTNIKYSLKITNFHEKTWSNFVFFENLLNHCKVLATTKGKRIPQNLLWFAIVKCCSVNISESAAFISSEMSALSDDWFYWFFVWEVRWDVWTVLIQQQRISKFAVLSGAGSIPPPPHHRTFLGDPPTWGCQHPSSGNNCKRTWIMRRTLLPEAWHEVHVLRNVEQHNKNILSSNN